MSDLERTKHFTTESEEICKNLVCYIPEGSKLIEPFCGAGDLLSLFPDYSWELYDIEDHGNNIVQDTLTNPPDYKQKWVITNPPYLAKNKSKDKTIFNLYDVDDLYKASLLSILDCEGGILIIPTNFFSDERTKNVRLKFLSKFEIKEINVFTKPMFNTTTYSICSFAFQKSSDTKIQNVKINILPEGEIFNAVLNKEYGYRIAGDYFKELSNIKPIFNRLVGTTSNDFITKIKLYAIDTRNDRIRLTYGEEPYYGKNTDRVYATLTSKINLSEEQQRELVQQFNLELENFRRQYYDLPMTNYRDFNRKRIGFTFAYQLLTKIYNEN